MRSTKQELHELLAENLLTDLQNIIDQLDDAIARAGIYTPSNNALVHRSKVLRYKLEKLQNSLAVFPNNGMSPSDPSFINYTITE